MARILLVEDSRTQAAEISMLLRAADHEVHQAVDGRCALERLAGDPIDVVVTDLEMPELNGLQLVEAMRIDYPHVPAILITSRGSEELASQALRQGAASYVPKSHLKAMLADTIANVMGVMAADASYAKLIQTLTHNSFKFRLPNDPELISPLVGLVTQVVAGMQLLPGMELVRYGSAVEHAIANAMFRGNLELSRQETPSVRGAIYNDETSSAIQQRLTQPPYRDRVVHVLAQTDERSVCVCVTDEGPGFDPSAFPGVDDPESLDESSGRGLVLMRSFTDELTFNDRGNEVTLIKTFGA